MSCIVQDAVSLSNIKLNFNANVVLLSIVVKNARKGILGNIQYFVICIPDIFLKTQSIYYFLYSLT